MSKLLHVTENEFTLKETSNIPPGFYVVKDGSTKWLMEIIGGNRYKGWVCLDFKTEKIKVYGPHSQSNDGYCLNSWQFKRVTKEQLIEFDKFRNKTWGVEIPAREINDYSVC